MITKNLFYIFFKFWIEELLFPGLKKRESTYLPNEQNEHFVL